MSDGADTASKSMKSKSVFCISEGQIRQLVRPNPDAANLISAFMVLACYTDSTGVYSSAGAKAVRMALRIGQQNADRLLSTLKDQGMIHDANKLHASKVKDAMPQREGRAAIRWVLKPDKTRKVWISSQIVRGFGAWRNPLHTLRQCGSDAARILLALYLYEDVVAYGGIDLTAAIYRGYTVSILRDYIQGNTHLFSCYEEKIACAASFIAIY